jgi:hypothetical protein
LGNAFADYITAVKENQTRVIQTRIDSKRIRIEFTSLKAEEAIADGKLSLAKQQSKADKLEALKLKLENKTKETDLKKQEKAIRKEDLQKFFKVATTPFHWFKKSGAKPGLMAQQTAEGESYDALTKPITEKSPDSAEAIMHDAEKAAREEQTHPPPALEPGSRFDRSPHIVHEKTFLGNLLDSIRRRK